MHDDEAIAAADAVTALVARMGKDAHLGPELQRARRDFFPAGDTTHRLPGAADAAELRFAEWVTLERESEVLGAVPVEVAAWAGEAADFADSVAGVWLVGAAGRRGVVARDLQDDQSVDLDVPDDTLQPGDLVVGRLFAQGAGRWTPSTAAAIFRPGAELAAAFARDLERLDLGRRLSQVELEHLLLRREAAAGAATGPVAATRAQEPAEPAVPLEHLEADLDQMLQQSGSAHTAASVSQELALAERPGQVMGPLLDELAFDTGIDLDRARELLLAIWNAHHRGEAAPAPSDAPMAPGETLGERLVRTLDEGLAQKRDVGELFAQLERMAGIEPEPEEPEDVDDDDDDEASPPPRRGMAADADADADGNLQALVEEYLWETGRSDEPADSPLRLFAALQQNAALPHRDLEDITASDVMRILLHVYLGSAPHERAVRVRATFDELRGFYRWAVEVQEMELAGVLDGCRGGLLDQLDRLQAAGVALSTPARGAERPGVLEVEEVGPRGLGVRDDDGNDHWLTAPAAALATLHVGDLLLGAMVAGPEGRTLRGLVVVLPADARSLIE